MKKGPLNRQEFLRLSTALAGSTVIAACKETQVSPTVIHTTVSAVTSGIRLRDVDVWAYVTDVHGSMQSPGVCQAVWIGLGEGRMPAVLNEFVFSASVPVYPGNNPLRAICQHVDEEEELSNEVNITGRLQQRPTAIITPTLEQGLVILDGRESQTDELESRPIREYIWSARAKNPAGTRVQADPHQEPEDFRGEVRGARIEVDLPEVDGEYYFALRVVDEAGGEDRSETYVLVENGAPRIPDYDHENPAWVEKAIVYGVIPRLFGSPGAGAIHDKLDELADLGITALWLAPINKTNDYGYSVIDYFELRDGFGSKEDFRAMIQAAHERKIRVLMDFVPNHTSNQHPYFKDTLEKGQDSPYWGFYDRDENGKYTYYFDWTHLPNLNYNNPEVRRMMFEAFSYWVREFDVDGFRVDACWGVQQRRPDFWPEWRRELKRIKPDLLLLAEASARDPYNFDNGFDAAYDWTHELGHWAWGMFWGDQAPKLGSREFLPRLKAALTNEPDGYHPDALIFRFLNNNDTRTRFIATHGEELTRVATALLLTLPGLPCIYTADELGQSFLPYDSGLISWREHYRGLRDYHKKLIALRKEVPSLHSRHWQLLDLEPADQALGYLRFQAGNEAPVLVLLNFSGEEAVVPLNLPGEFSSLTNSGRLFDHLNEEIVPLAEENRLRMVPMRARILTSREA